MWPLKIVIFFGGRAPSFHFWILLFLLKKSFRICNEEDKIWDKAWRAQQAHVHGPIKGQAHSLCEAPDRTRAQTCPPRFRFLKTCSARKGLGPQGQDLSYKEKTCATRRRLALQGKEQRPHYYKSPNILLT